MKPFDRIVSPTLEEITNVQLTKAQRSAFIRAHMPVLERIMNGESPLPSPEVIATLKGFAEVEAITGPTRPPQEE